MSEEPKMEMPANWPNDERLKLIALIAESFKKHVLEYKSITESHALLSYRLMDRVANAPASVLERERSRFEQWLK